MLSRLDKIANCVSTITICFLTLKSKLSYQIFSSPTPSSALKGKGNVKTLKVQPAISVAFTLEKSHHKSLPHLSVKELSKMLGLIFYPPCAA